MKFNFLFFRLASIGLYISALDFKQKSFPQFQNTFNAVILPGFGNDIADYINFKNELESRGICATIVPIKRIQWLNIAKSIFTTDYWTLNCKPENLFDFYYSSVDRTVRRIVHDCNNTAPVVLIAHSAGGWLARGMIGNGSWIGSNLSSSSLISGLVTLGTPHSPPINDGEDMTRGALRYIDTNFPGSYLNKEIFYVTVAGTAVISNSSAPQSSLEYLAARSYSLVRGVREDSIIGDGVVPLSCAHLDKSQNITLANVYHFVNAKNNQWYGGKNAVDIWLPIVLLTVEKRMRQKSETESCRLFPWLKLSLPKFK